MTRSARLLLAGPLLLLMAHAAQALGDEKVEGVVRRTKVTHCDVTKTGGCAGTLTMERRGEGKSDLLTVQVPLGTPISCDGDRALLHTLQDKPVVVTLISGGRPVARAVRVAEAEPC